MWKHILILALILTVIGGYIFWVSSREQTTFQGTPKQDSPSPVGVEESAEHDNTDRPVENTEPGNTETLVKIQDIKSVMSDVFTEKERATSKFQRMFEVLESPEYAAFLESGQSSNFAATFDFFASQGVQVDKNDLLEVFQGIFQQHFPGETPAAVEPQMRQTLTKLISESDTDFIGVLMDFISNEKYNAWGMLHFQMDTDAFATWAIEVVKNPIPLATAPHSTEVPAVVETEVPVSPSEGEPADTRLSGTLPTVPSESLPAPSIDPTAPDDGDVDVVFEAEIRALLEQSLPNPSEPPAEASFEKLLREAFSPQRLNTALQTLNRYGPEEGLRRLKTSDPEVATQIERFIQGNNKESD